MKDSFIEINKLPKTLNKEDTNKLLKEIAEGNNESKKILLNHNIRLVLYQVNNRFFSVEYDKKDLVSVGTIGLIKAVNTFDLSKNITFATYAIRCIDNEILMFLRKIKKEQNISSLDKIISNNEDGKEILLKDVIEADINIEEDYTDNETYIILRNLVEKLPEREKEMIKMYFGFYQDKKYTQREIAEKLNLAQSYISRFLKKTIKKLGLELKKLNVETFKNYSLNIKQYNTMIENKEKTKNDLIIKKEVKNNMGRKIQPIYKYFKKYTREQVDEMLKRLTPEERKLVSIKYGNDLDNPSPTAEYTDRIKIKFYNSLNHKMEKILDSIEKESKEELIKEEDSKKEIETVYSMFSNHSKEEINNMLIELTDEEFDILQSVFKKNLSKPATDYNEEALEKYYKIVVPKMKILLNEINMKVEEEPLVAVTKIEKNNNVESERKETTEIVETTSKDDSNQENNNNITKENYKKILELLRTPSFAQMINILSPKEAIIIALKLGYVDEKYFTTESIADFLGIEKEEVRETTKKVLNLYKENINQFIDEVIEVATEQRKILN